MAKKIDNKDVDKYVEHVKEALEKFKLQEHPKNRKKKFQGRIDDCEIYTVNGDYIKEKDFMDFVEGGNWKVYPKFIPKMEIWVDEEIKERDWKYILLHELTESYIMDKYDYAYPDAHDIANKYEKAYRKKTDKLTESLFDKFYKSVMGEVFK
jgi:hypothetical protein